MSALLNRVWGELPVEDDGDAPADMMRMLSGSVFSGLMKNRSCTTSRTSSWRTSSSSGSAAQSRVHRARVRVGAVAAAGPRVPGARRRLPHEPEGPVHRALLVAPFVEEDVDEFARHFPVDRILFGSDWPHGEGYAEPKDFLANVANFSIDDQRRIMYANAHDLTFN